MKIVVYCDGACSKNGKNGAKGGMGVYFPDGKKYNLDNLSIHFDPEDYDFMDGKTTNQRTELGAIYETLKYIEENYDLKKIKIRIFSDSMYSVKTINQYHLKWHKSDDLKWTKADGKPVKNVELISPILEYFENCEYDIKIFWVRGHGDSQENNMADKLARDAVDDSTN